VLLFQGFSSDNTTQGDRGEKTNVKTPRSGLAKNYRDANVGAPEADKSDFLGLFLPSWQCGIRFIKEQAVCAKSHFFLRCF
jgi:hypothetical protein